MDGRVGRRKSGGDGCKKSEGGEAVGTNRWKGGERKGGEWVGKG